MSSEWRSFKLAEVGRIVTGKTPQGGNPEFFRGLLPFVTPGDFASQKWITETTRTVSEAGAQSVKGSLIPPRSVLVTCIGSDMGKASIASGRCLTNQQINAVVVDEARFSPEFLFYNLALRKAEIRSIAGGSAQPILNKTAFGAIQVSFPSLGEQRRIADLLGPLDDRIALLRETNATLEAIAKALFKSWFVDFDPVRAKQQGLAPVGMDEATATLFPNSFEESALGLVPKEWRQGTVSDFAQMHRGSVNPGGSGDTLFEHYSLPAFDAGQMPVRELGDEIKSNKTLVPRDSVLLSKLNPHIPRVWLPVDAGPHAVCSTEFLVIVPAVGASREFAYCSFVAAPFQERLRQLVTGTSNSHQRVKPDGVLTLSTVMPPSPALDAFTLVVRPMFERVGLNRLQAQTLATLRDTLLPRLISGQLRLPEAEVSASI